MARLPGCVSLSEPSLVAYEFITKVSCAGLNVFSYDLTHLKSLVTLFAVKRFSIYSAA